MMFPGLPPHAPVVDVWRWATVQAVAPLRVQLDGDSAPLGSTPDSLIPVSVSDRVLCHLHHHTLTVIGVQRGGTRSAYAAGPASNIVPAATAASVLTVTVTAASAGTLWRVDGHLDAIGPTSGYLIMELQVDGAVQTRQGVLGSTSRIPVTQTWMVTGLSAGSHTLTLTARNTSGDGTATVTATHGILIAQQP